MNQQSIIRECVKTTLEKAEEKSFRSLVLEPLDHVLTNSMNEKPTLSSCQERVEKNCQPNLTVFAESTECHNNLREHFLSTEIQNFRNFKPTVNPPAPSVEKISVNPYQ